MKEHPKGTGVTVGRGMVYDLSPKYTVVYNLSAFKDKENYLELRKIEKRINELEDEIVATGKGFIYYIEDMDLSLLGALKDDLIIISHIQEGDWRGEEDMHREIRVQ